MACEEAAEQELEAAKVGINGKHPGFAGSWDVHFGAEVAKLELGFLVQTKDRGSPRTCEV